MFDHNFRENNFEGNLLELLQICNPHLSRCRQSLTLAAQWIEERIDADREIYPVRKHSGFSRRGETLTENHKEFVAVDNELLAALLNTWIGGSYVKPEASIKEMILDKKIPLSWKLDVPFSYAADLKGSPVKSNFRDCGLKIAHIMPAGMTSNCNFVMRYLRTLHPYNIFLFPSSKIVRFDSHNHKASVSDWAEDETVQKIAWGYVCSMLELNDAQMSRLSESIGGLKKFQNWREEAERIAVRVVGRSDNPAVTSRSETAPRVRPVRLVTEPHQNPTINNGDFSCQKGKARHLDEVLQWLRDWLRRSPSAVQLNGSPISQSAPGAWIHFELNDFVSPRDDFKPRYENQIFKGDSYNGSYFLPGDFKREAAILLLEMAENSESPSDIFQTTATHEIRNTAPQSGQKRSLVLKNYRGLPVNGCYIYKKNN